MSVAQMLLLNIPSLVLCLVMMMIAGLLSIVGTLFFHHFIPHRSLKIHNDITGPIFGTLGVIYAVLLAFMVVVVWQDFDRARLNAEKEVNCLVNLYIDSEPFEETFREKIHGNITEYTKAIIDEWDTLAKGKYNPEAAQKIEKLVMLYAGYSPRNETEKAFFEESIDKINELYDLRILRLISSHKGIHSLLWFVLIVGAVITIIFTIFFGTESLNAKIVMSTLLAVLITLILFIILEFSFPFIGSAKVPSEPFKQLLIRLNP